MIDSFFRCTDAPTLLLDYAKGNYKYRRKKLKRKCDEMEAYFTDTLMRPLFLYSHSHRICSVDYKNNQICYLSCACFCMCVYFTASGIFFLDLSLCRMSLRKLKLVTNLQLLNKE